MSAYSLEKLWPNWEIIDEIGSGSFGKVYRAENILTDSRGGVISRKTAAIKVIRISTGVLGNYMKEDGITGDATRQYLEDQKDICSREIKALNELGGHPNIVSIEDYGEIELTEDTGWDIVIRMPLLVPFEEYLKSKGGTLDEKTVILLGKDISNALIACEERGILHRDIKPGNIFYDPRTRWFKLGDFGIARELEKAQGNLTNRGTPNYAAPEAWFSPDYDARADQYSLGIVLYRLMNRNRPPFADQSGANGGSAGPGKDPNTRRLNGEPLPPPCDASPAMKALILKACSPRPEDRFSGAAELYDALKRVANGTYRPDSDRTERLRQDRGNGSSDGTQALRRPPAGAAGNGSRTGQPGRRPGEGTGNRTGQPGRRPGEGTGNRTGQPGRRPGEGTGSRTGQNRSSGSQKRVPEKKSRVWIPILITVLVILAAGGYFAYDHWLKPQDEEAAVQTVHEIFGATPAASGEDMIPAAYTVEPLDPERGIPIFEEPDTGSVSDYVIGQSAFLDSVSGEGGHGWGHTVYNEWVGYVELNACLIVGEAVPAEQPAGEENIGLPVRYLVVNTDGKTLGLYLSPSGDTLATAGVHENDQVLVHAFRNVEGEEWAYAVIPDTQTGGWIPRYYLY